MTAFGDLESVFERLQRGRLRPIRNVPHFDTQILLRISQSGCPAHATLSSIGSDADKGRP